MPKGSAKPALRFKGFTDAWEQRKVGEMIEDYVEKTIIQNQFPVLTSSQQQGIVLQEEYFADRQVTTDDNIGYYVLPKGYFTYRSRSDTNTFVFNRNDIIDKGIISYYYPVFKANNADSNFLLRRLNHGTKSQLSFIAEGTGQKVLAHSKFKNIAVYVPNIEEQKSIGSFFENLDTLITLHQRKCDKLMEVKKSMLERMFPKDGANVAEVRFKGFTEAWDKRKVEEITTSYSGGTPTVGVKMYYGGTIPFIRSAEINCDSTELFITEEGLKNSSAKLVSVGDILYALYGATGGEVGRAKLNGAINQAILAVKPMVNYDAEFISQWLRKNKQNIVESYLQGGQGNLSGEIVRGLVVDLPSYDEQIVIGKYFRCLDTLITLYQHKLEKLKNIKKACLEKMFA